MSIQYTLSKKPILICDVREQLIINEIESLPESKKIKIIKQQLPIGDFIIHDIIIERKSFNDFVSSIIDKRIFRQIEELTKEGRALLIVEGPFVMKRNFSINAYIGALSYIISNYEKLSIIFTFSPKETAKLIIKIALKKQRINEDTYKVKVVKKKGLRNEDLVIYILSSFPGISVKTAKKIIDKFGTIKNFINAKPEELKRLLGEKKAKKIIEILNYKGI